jgi:voltage-gated potassium channel Kch
VLSFIYHIGRLFMSKGWIVGLLLIALTVGIGTHGFLATKWADGSDLSFSDAIYHAISLLAIQSGAVPTVGNLPLELARWLGMLFWASALLTVAIRLFRESVHGLLVTAFARDHVIVAGLGQAGGRLVEALRAKGRTVVVIEPDRNHPAVDQCRRIGAIVLFGEPDDPRMLLAANLPVASVVLALFVEERVCVRTATAAYQVLRSEEATPKKPPVRFVLRLTEPGLLDVVRRHKIKTDPTDRIQLEILNSHEIVATTMVREATANSLSGSIEKILVLGLGTYHRLGEMVILRAAKDHLINHDGIVPYPLLVHVFDKDADAWLTGFVSRYPFVKTILEIQPRQECWARKVGPDKFDRDYDAAFVCIADEGPATAQAAMLRRDVLTDGQPIMVRVTHSQSGYGELIAHPDSGWGENIHAVGLEDSLVDSDTATQPEMELRAHTIHHDFRATMRRKHQSAPTEQEKKTIAQQSTNVPWGKLKDEDKAQNRALAERYDEYLAFVDGADKTVKYRRVFAPFQTVGQKLLFKFPDTEVTAIARREHLRFVATRMAEGWTYAKERDDILLKSPYIQDFDKLTKDQKSHNLQFASGMTRILALADNTIVIDQS